MLYGDAPLVRRDGAPGHPRVAVLPVPALWQACPVAQDHQRRFERVEYRAGVFRF